MLLFLVWMLSAGPAESGSALPVEIRVTDATSPTPIRNVYVALYAPDDAWTRPSFETVSDTGAVTVTLPAGSYQMIAGARGFDLGGRTIDVAPGSRVALTVPLTPAAITRTGTVNDTAGRPIAGARITLVRSPASDLARQHLGSEWTTTSDENGWWSLLVPSDFVLPLLIEARGFGPSMQTSRPADAATPLDVVLTAGGSLRVELDRVDADWMLTLPDKGEAFDRRATSRIVEWEGLEPGPYRVRLRPRDPARLVSQEVTASVTAGGRAALQMRVPTTTGSRATTLFLPRRQPRELSGLRAWSSVQQVTSATEAASGGTLLHIDAPSAAGVFATTKTELIIPAARAATVHARGDAKLRVLSATEGVAVPASGHAIYADCPQDRRITLPLQVAHGGAITVPAPVDCRTLIVALPPLERVAIPIRVAKGETQWLGEHALSAGAEADVRVAWEPSGRPAAAALVRVVQRVDDRDTAVAEAVADADGKVTLTGLPADEEIIIEAQSDETSTVGTSTVTIAAATRAVIDPLPLPEPAKLTIRPRLAAQYRELDPAAEIMAMSIERHRRTAKSPARNDGLDERGAVVFENLQPGRWLVRAIVRSSEAGQPVDVGEVELKPGEEREIEPEIAPLVFRARLVAGGSVRGWSLAVADPRGWNAIRRRFQTQENGVFRVVLGKAGLYRVTAHTGSHEIDLGDVSFTDPAREIELVVPQGSLLTTVRREGRPVASVDVTLRLRQESRTDALHELTMRGRTDGEGVARFSGLREGRWLARASTAERESAEATVLVARDTESRVTLDLSSSGAVEGVVRDPAGRVVARARVDCLSSTAHGPWSQSTETDVEGRFTFEMTSVPPLLRCSVTSRQGVVGAYLVRPTATVDLTLGPAGAPLRIVDWGEQIAGRDVWLVAADGRVVNLAAVAAKVGGSRTPALIPQFPVGSWKVLRARTFGDWSAIANGMAGSAELIEEVRLEPGRITDLAIYGGAGR
ncbi:MAG TPA: hypothetical protein VF111_07340 [Thermoanaerobaculia bacterium]